MRMKKLFMVLLLGILLVTTVSALDFDNFKYKRSQTFDGKQVNGNQLLERYSPIEIKNAFGLGSKLFEGYLSEHDDVCGIECESTIQIKTYNDGPLIDEVTFYTLREGSEWIEQDVRSYQFSYLGEIDDYEVECIEDGEYGNGTKIQTCNRVKSGSHIGPIDYEIGESMKAGTYSMKLEARKKPSRTVDWIIKTNGETLSGWATWGNISEGDDGEVILNSPDDELILASNPQTFNASANITGGATLVNMSLWTNETGDWAVANTTIIPEDFIYTDGTPSVVGMTTTPGFVIANLNDGAWLAEDDTDSTGSPDMVNGAFYRIDLGQDFSVSTVGFHLLGDGTGGVQAFDWNITVNGTSVTGGSYDGGAKISENITITPTQGTFVDIVFSNINGANNIIGELTAYYNGTRSRTQTWERTITSVTLWNVRACDSDGDCGFASNNRTIIIDTVEPEISVEAPSGIINYGEVGRNETLNVTFTDINLDSCWYDYNGTNVTIEGCQSGVKNSTKFILEENNLDIRVYANDSNGNLNSSLIEWGYNIFTNSINFSNQTTSGAVEEFKINVTFNDTFSGVSVVLNYNGTNNSMSTSDTGTTREYITTLTIPSVTVETNVTVFFIATLSKGEDILVVNTNSQNQTINPFLIDDCSSFTKKLLIFEMVDEDSLSEINGTIEFTINIFSLGTTTLVNSFNDSYEYIIGESSEVCLDDIEEEYSMSYQIRHFGDEVQYFKKYRNIQLRTINNDTIPENITLYNLNLSRGHAFNIIIVGNLLSTQGNVGLLVDSQRQYLATDEFVSVESPITNSEGIAISNLVQAEEIYNFLISFNGELLGTFNNYQVKCANAALGQCSITLNLATATGTQTDFESVGNITQLILLDTSTNTVHHTFSSTDGISKTVTSLVIKDDGYGNTTICNGSSTGTSGTILCAIPVQFRNVSIFVQTFESNVLLGSKYISQGAETDWQGADILIILLMFSSLVLLMVAHPIAIIVGALLGMTMPIILIAVAQASYSSVVGAVLFYIAGGIVAIVVMNKKKN